LPFGKVTPAIHHGAALFLSGSIHGIDAHGARPHQGKNAIDILFAIQQMLKNIYLNPFDVYSAKLTKIVADGGSTNIIPGNATFSMDVRAQKNSVLDELQIRINGILKQVSEMFDTEIEWKWKPILTSGSDDFHFYTVLRPKLKAAMIGIGADLTPGLHHPKMTFKKESLIIGSKVLTTTLRNAANQI
ncbi:bacterial exopeptidase dimerization domain-containing protein, partial [Rhizophagus irregularis]